MPEIAFRRERDATGERLLLSTGHVEVSWEQDAHLVLTDPQMHQTRVSGGALLELVPPPGDHRSHVHGLGHEMLGAQQAPEQIHDAHGAGLTLRRRFPVAVQPLVVEKALTLYEDYPFVRLEMTVTNTGEEPLALRRAFPFVCGAWWGSGSLVLHERIRDFAVYKQGWQSWSYAGGLPPGKADPRPQAPTLVLWHSPGGRAPRQPVSGTVDVVSEEVALLGHPEQRVALLAGFLEARTWLGQIYAQRHEGALAACALLDDWQLQPGEALSVPPLLLALGPQEALLDTYAQAVAREQHARPPRVVPSGWSSWYYYFSRVTEADVLENLEALRTARELLPVRVVQIDDGYQSAVGDWLEPNESFPGGLRALAEQIRAAGYQPGLWVAPFTVAANSRLAAEHPDWLVQDAAGHPQHGGRNWNTDLFALDTSHPDARDWLRSLFDTLVNDWGFAYLKLDFLASAALAGQRYDRRTTRAQALRDGLDLIRGVVGERTFLLACGCPLLGAVGLVDAMRIGPDSAPYWGPRLHGLPLPLSEGHALPTMEGALRNTLTRAWMHNTLWANDPDCLLLRETDSELTLTEVQAFASAVGLTGAMVLLSDRVQRLTLDRLEIFARLLPPLPERAQPTSYLTFGIPDSVVARIERPWGTWLLIGLFNGGAQEREMAVRWEEVGLAPGRYHAVEFWSGAYLGRSETALTTRVPAHGAAVLAVHPLRDQPHLLSTSFHLSQGAVEIAAWSYDAAARAIRWHARLGRRAAGTFTHWLPAGLWPRRLESDAQAAGWRVEARGVVVVTAEIRDEAHFTLELESEPEAGEHEREA